MTLEVDYYTLGGAGIESLRGVESYIAASPLDRRLVELVKVRVSQLNGCAHCAEMHIEKARQYGESDDRLHMVAVWREAPCFTRRERTALGWAEALTGLAERAPDDAYERAHQQFDDQELVDLGLAIGTINVWNRLAVSFHRPEIDG